MARPAPPPNLGAMETRIARREAALFVIIQAILGIGAAIVAAAEGVDVRHIEDASSFGQAVAYGAALNLEGLGTDEWTAKQVDARRDRSIDEVVAEWDEIGPGMEELLPLIDEAQALSVVGDIAAHEMDVWGALGRAEARDADSVHLGFVRYRNALADRVAAAGLAPLDVSLLAPQYELFRAMTGRRSADQPRTIFKHCLATPAQVAGSVSRPVLSVTSAILSPWPSCPTRFSRGTRTSRKLTTPLASARSPMKRQRCSIFTPGQFVSTMKLLMRRVSGWRAITTSNSMRVNPEFFRARVRIRVAAPEPFTGNYRAHLQRRARLLLWCPTFETQPASEEWRA